MKRALLLSASCGILYLALTSSSFGPGGQALNGTGSPGANATCGGCHSGGSGTTTGTVQLRKLSTGITGPIVTTYYPDTAYIVKVVGNNASLSHFGFQLTALKTGNTNAGTFTNVTGNMHIASVGSKNIVEHTDQLAKTNNQYEAVFNWTAPAAGTGTVNFYGVINGVDNTGGSNNDKPGNPFNVALTEAVVTSVNSLAGNIQVKAYPNPVTTQLNISFSNAETGTYSLVVFDMNGKKILNKDISIQTATHDLSINTANWASGLYHVQLAKDNSRQTIAVTKN